MSDVHQKIAVTSTQAGARTTTAAPAPAPGVDLYSASAVAIAEVKATWTLDTTVDVGWYAGELAASAYMTPRYATSIRKNPPTGAPGASWIAWAAHRATTSVTANIEADPGEPRDSAFTAYRKVLATVTPHGTSTPGDTATSNDAVVPQDPATPAQTETPDSATGWVGPSEVWVIYVVLSRSSRDDPWRVAQSETTP